MIDNCSFSASITQKSIKTEGKLFITVVYTEHAAVRFCPGPFLCLHQKIYKHCRHKLTMVYTEVRNINGRKYFYRTLSERKGKKVFKKRVYLGSKLSNSEILAGEVEADKKLLSKSPKENKQVENIKSKIIGALKKNKVIRAGVFGSYSRGEQKKNSDIDILIEIDPDYSKNISLIDLIRLERFLEKKLGRKVDLVEYSSLHHLLKNRILKEEIRII